MELTEDCCLGLEVRPDWPVETRRVHHHLNELDYLSPEMQNRIAMTT